MPTNLDGIMQKAREHLDAREWQEAVRCCREALSLRPDFPEAEELFNDAQQGQAAELAYNLGLRFIELERWGEAITKLEEAETSSIEFPDLPAKLEFARRQQEMESLHQKALQHEKAGQWTEAVATLENLCKLDKNYEQAGERLEAARDELELQKAYERCQTQMKRKNWVSALDIIRKIEQRRPDYPNIQSLKVEAENNIRWERWAKEATNYEHDEDWEEAIALYKKILQENPDFTGLLERLAEARRQRDLKAAYEGADDYLKQEKWELAREGLDWVLVQAPDYKEAEAKREIAQNALEGHKRLDEVDQHLEADRLAEARNALNEANRLIPPDSSLHERLVETQERFEEQERKLKQAINNELRKTDEAFVKGSLVEAQRILVSVRERYPGYEEKEIEDRLRRIEEALRPSRPKWKTWLTYVGSAIAVLAGIAAILTFLFGEAIFKDIFVRGPTATPSVILKEVPESTPILTDTPTTLHTPTSMSTPATTDTSKPLPPPTPTPKPDAVVNVEALNLRAGPGIEYRIIRTLEGGEILTVLGRTPNGDWLHVRTPRLEEGWVNASYVDLSGNLDPVPTVFAPTPLWPLTEDGICFVNQVKLEWTWIRPLAESEYFSVRVSRQDTGEECFHDKTQNNTIYLGSLVSCNPGKLFWKTVAVRLVSKDPERWLELSPSSEPQLFDFERE